MKRITFILLLLPALAFGQVNKIRWFVLSNSTGVAPAPSKTYDPLAPIVAFDGDSTLLVAATVGSSITQPELGTGIDYGYLESNFTNTARVNGLVGNASQYKVIRGLYSGYSRVGSGLNGAVTLGQTGSTSNYFHYNHIIAYGNGEGVTTSTGFQGTGQAGGTSFSGTDLILVHAASPGIQFNGDGDAGTYDSIYFKSIRIVGNPALDGSGTTEGFYGGDTSLGGTAGLTRWLWVEDMHIQNTTWDLMQMNGINTANVINVTGDRGGLENVSGQRGLFQAQNIGHLNLSYSIFWDAVRTFQIATRSADIEHNLWYASDVALYQDLVNDAGYDEHIAPQDTLVYFNSNEIYSKVARTYGIQVSEDSTVFIFINNIVDADSITTFIQDSRSSPVYPLYEINTKRQSRPINDITYNSTDSTNAEAYKIQNDYLYDKGYGYRVPAKTKVEPDIYSFTPTTAEAGDSVDIVGDRFTGADSVFFEYTKAIGFRVVNDELIRVAVPSGIDAPEVGDKIIIIVYVNNLAGAKYGFTVDPGVLPFNPYTDISWVAAFNPTEFSAGTWPNSGSGSDASQGSAAALPTQVSGLSTKSTYGLSFVNSSGTGLQYTSGTVTEPFETWIEIITPSSFTGTQRIYANGSATRCTINSSGQILVAGTSDVSTGLTLSTNTRYVLRIVNNGASSSITANNGTPLTFTITAQNGSSTPKIGHAYSAGSGHVNMTIGDLFQKSGLLDSGQQTQMWNWFGF